MDATQRHLLCSVLIGVASIATAPLAIAQSTGTTSGMTLAAIETAYSAYERIEVSFGPTQVKVEAVDAETGQTIEAIYDRATGEILKQETGTVSGPVGSGVEVKSRMEDFVRDRASDRADEGLDHAFDDSRHGGHDDATEDDHGDDASQTGSSRNDHEDRGRGRSGRDDGAPDDNGQDHAGDDHGGGDHGGGRGASDDHPSGDDGSDDDGDDD